MNEWDEEMLDFCVEEQKLVLVQMQVTDVNTNWHQEDRMGSHHSHPRVVLASGFRCSDAVIMDLFASALCFPLC